MYPMPEADALEAVLSEYQLRGATVASTVETGRRNHSYVVEDANGVRFVLRRYRRNPIEARVIFQLRFQQELSGRGFPTAEVIQTRTGELLVHAASSLWALFSYVEGQGYDFTRLDQAGEAGRRLAQFHLVTQDIEMEEVPLEINSSIRRFWTHWEIDLDELRAEFRGEDIEEQLTSLRHFRDELVSRLPLDRFDTLASGWAHGDYHGLNIVFAGTELRGLFDFDALNRGRYVEDIGYGLFMFGRESRGSRKIRPDAARAFIDAYYRVRPVSHGEREAVLLVAPVGWVGRGAYYAMLRRDGDDPLAYFRRHVDTMRAVAANRDTIAKVLGLGSG